MQDKYAKFLNGDSIKRMVHSLFEPWMSETDKQELEQEILSSVGDVMDQAITTGIKNGYSIDKQEKMVSIMFGLN